MNKRIKKRRDNREPVKINFRLIGAIALVLYALFLKFNPTAFNQTLNLALSTNCDYPLMLTELSEVIKKHTLSKRVFKLPLSGIVTSPFGKRQSPDSMEEENHTGIDIDAPLGTEVFSAYKGKVTRVEENEFYGKFVMVDHGGGLVSLYGHLSEQKVNIGDEADENTVVGLSGNSGRSTGPHLHFEIRKDGQCVNPQDYIY